MHKFSHIISFVPPLHRSRAWRMRKGFRARKGSDRGSIRFIKILTIGTADSGGTIYPVGRSDLPGQLRDSDSTLKLNVTLPRAPPGMSVPSNREASISDSSAVMGFAAVNGKREFKMPPFKVDSRSSRPSIQSISNWMAWDDSGILRA